jgi:hypothetical protein
MNDLLIITTILNACLNANDENLSHQLEDQLRRNFVFDIDTTSDLSSLYHTADLSNPFIQ